jgi:hypothetical protein
MDETTERGVVPIVCLRKGRPIPLTPIPYGTDEWKFQDMPGRARTAIFGVLFAVLVFADVFFLPYYLWALQRSAARRNFVGSSTRRRTSSSASGRLTKSSSAAAASAMVGLPVSSARRRRP